MIDSITMSLQKGMKNKNLEGLKLYLFGSSLNSSSFNDIDLLIEYDDRKFNISSALELRAEISESLRKEFQTEVDICLLSTTENNQTQFIIKEKGILLQLTTA